MPILDEKTGSFVVRIVYDGPPFAGKTTNVVFLHRHLLSAREGAIHSPHSQSERTAFFDFREFDGGFVDGKRVKVQVVSVPGQLEYIRRRIYLLQSADAVVFVADSSKATLEAQKQALDTLYRIRRGRFPNVIQANKQDAVDALDPSTLREALGAPTDIPTLGAQATHGRGVTTTFCRACKAAMENVRTAEAQVGELSAEALEEAIRAFE